MTNDDFCRMPAILQRVARPMLAVLTGNDESRRRVIYVSLAFANIPFFPSSSGIYSYPVNRFKHTAKFEALSLSNKNLETPLQPPPTTMKTSSSIAAFGLMALTAAAPADVIRRQAPSTASASSYAVGTASASLYPSSFGTASAYYPSGTAATGYYPSGTMPAYPIGTGSSCSSNGELVCSADGTQFGICNFGVVSFQAAAAGTKCVDGMIQFA